MSKHIWEEAAARKQGQQKPICCLISDIHYSTATLSLAQASMRAALAKAKSLNVPLVVAGDLLDGKAIIRAECANALVELLSNKENPPVYIIPGNHCKVNEKGKEHALNFLSSYCAVIDIPTYIGELSSWLIPYQSSPDALQLILRQIPAGSRIIMHQGVQTAYLGHYVQDKSSLPKEAFANFRVISGHYHRAQDIQCGRPRKDAVGLFSYIGSPYTQSFSEAEDGPKGFQILMDSGMLKQVPLSLRKHVIIEMNEKDEWIKQDLRENDLVWVKLYGSQLELDKIKKRDVAEKIIGHANFKLDKIRTDSAAQIKINKRTEPEILDAIIDGTSETPERKSDLKKLWREICASSIVK